MAAVASTRRIDGETPDGGAYMEVTFLDGPLGRGDLVDEADATHAVIREYDAEDNLIRETWGSWRAAPDVAPAG